jgi:hypothetical protein
VRAPSFRFALTVAKRRATMEPGSFLGSETSPGAKAADLETLLSASGGPWAKVKRPKLRSGVDLTSGNAGNTL